MRAGILVGLLLVISTVDITSTWYLLNNAPGKEINPFIHTDSFLRLAFSPIPTIVDIIFLACVYLAEEQQHRFREYMAARHLKRAIFFFPLYYLLILFMATSSNVLAVFGFGTPLSLLLKPFEFISNDSFIRLGFAYSFTILFTLPLFVRLATFLYGDLHKS